MNSKKRKSTEAGFTLVEVIVVAIIVAAMAAVAVPMYLNYVTTSRQNAAANAAGSIASFCGACINSAGGAENPITDNSNNAGGGSITCTPNGTSIQVPDDIIVEIELDAEDPVADDPTTPDVNEAQPGTTRGVTASHVAAPTLTASYNF